MSTRDASRTAMRDLRVREGWTFREVQVGLWQAINPRGNPTGSNGGLQNLAVTYLGRELERWEVHGLPEPSPYGDDAA